MNAPLEKGKHAELTSVSADLWQPPSRQSRLIIKSVAFAILGAVAWSYFTPLAEVAAGIGKVIPDKHLQAIQSVEGGYVVAILARSGDYVEKGQVLVRLDASASSTSHEEIARQIVGLKTTSTRLRALLHGTGLAFETKFAEQHQSAIADAMAQFNADNAELKASLSAFEAQSEQKRIELRETKTQLRTINRALALNSEELKALRVLQKSGAASRAEVMNSEQRNNELQGSRDQTELAIKRTTVAISELEDRADERRENFRARASAELTEAETRLASLSASLEGQQNRLDRTEIRAPMAGVLKTVKAINIGQVIKPYDEVAELVPDSESVVIQARIKPEDIGFVAKGHRAVIKLSAYDYSIFGALQGTLVKIAADSTTDERGQTYYAVDVQADKNFIERRGERWPVKPGMVANVEIITGQRTVMQYLTKPIHRMATMALRER